MLSVVIATSGRAPELARALGRLDRQSTGAEAFELIVVVDSPDGAVVETVESVVGRREYRVRVLRSPGRGASAARNAGVAEAGSLVLFINDDVLAAPDLIAEHLAWHDRHPDEAVAVLGHCRWADEVPPTAFSRWLDRGIQFDYGSIPGDRASWAHLYTANCSLKRGLLERAGGFDEAFELGYDDLELARRLHGLGLRVLYNRAARAEHLHPPTLDEWKRRMELVGRAERMMVRKHPDVAPFFHERLAAALAQVPSRGLAVHAEPFVPAWVPRLGWRVRERTDLWFCQQLAPHFLKGWNAA